jgi:hypothetical protein
VGELAPGRWQLIIGSEKAASFVEATVELHEGELTEESFSLPAGAVSGRVENAAGQPVPGAAVQVTAKENVGAPLLGLSYGGETKTDAGGAFRLGGLKAGSYVVLASKLGVGGACSEAVHVPVDGEASALGLKLGGGGGTVVSVARNADNGGAVKDVQSWLTSESGFCASNKQRSEQGEWVVESVPPGTYTLRVGGDLYKFTESVHTIEVKEGETVRVEDALVRGAHVQWILSRAGGEALGGVAVRLVPVDGQQGLRSYEGKTDASGMWMVMGVPSGRYTLSATVPQGGAVSERIEVEPFAHVMKVSVVP